MFQFVFHAMRLEKVLFTDFKNIDFQICLGTLYYEKLEKECNRTKKYASRERKKKTCQIKPKLTELTVILFKVWENNLSFLESLHCGISRGIRFQRAGSKSVKVYFSSFLHCLTEGVCQILLDGQKCSETGRPSINQALHHKGIYK